MGINKNFVVKQGLEVNQDLIFADANTKQVGINTTDPEYDLDVKGYVGVSTIIVNDTLEINGSVSLGSSIGALGQYLISTGSGVAWQSLPNTRQVEVFSATPSQTSFDVTYIEGLLDVFINGVKLSANEFTATNGTSVTLADACFGGETVEFVVYSSYNVGGYQETNIWNKTAAGVHTTSNVGIGTTNPITVLDVLGDARISGVITASSFSGNASSATYAITSGVSTSVIGDIGFITQLEVTGISSFSNGPVLIGSATSTGTESQPLQVTGDAYISGNLGIGTTIPTSKLTVSGDANITGIVTATGGFISAASTTPIQITLVGNELTFTAVGIGSTTLTLA